MTSQEFVQQLKKEIQAFPKIRIKHPFLKAVCNGTATMDQIRTWTIQDYQFRAAVPRIAMLRYLACNDPEIAQKLWGVVEEETRGMDWRHPEPTRRRRAPAVNRGSPLLRGIDYPYAAMVCRHVDSNRRRRHFRSGRGGARERLHSEVQDEAGGRSVFHRSLGSGRRTWQPRRRNRRALSSCAASARADPETYFSSHGAAL